MTGEIQFLPPDDEPDEEYTATVTLTTLHFADLGPVLDAIETLVRIAPHVTGKVEASSTPVLFTAGTRFPRSGDERDPEAGNR